MKSRKSKLLELRKSTVSKLVTNGRAIKGGAVQGFALLEGVDETGNFTTGSIKCNQNL